MPEKPLQNVVNRAIAELMGTTVEEDDDKGNNVQRAVIVVDQDRIGILSSLVERHKLDVNKTQSSDGLREAVQAGLNHPGADLQNVLYGVPLSSNTPYLWDVIAVKPKGEMDEDSKYAPLLVANDAYIDRQIAEATDALANLEVKHNPNDRSYSLDMSRAVKYEVLEGDLDAWGVGRHLVEQRILHGEEVLGSSPFTYTANKEAWKRMDHYTPDTLPYPLCFPQSNWERFMKMQTEKRKAATGRHGVTTAESTKRRKIEIEDKMRHHLTGPIRPDVSAQDAATEALLKRRREMLEYNQQHPLSLVDIVLTTKSRQGWDEEKEEKMQLDDDVMYIQERHTQTNPMADIDVDFQRYLDCWPPLARHQRNIVTRAPAAAARDEQNIESENDVEG